MKKTVLVLITFALIIAVAGSGFWLVHYFIDSREQKEKMCIRDSNEPVPH